MSVKRGLGFHLAKIVHLYSIFLLYIHKTTHSNYKCSKLNNQFEYRFESCESEQDSNGLESHVVCFFTNSIFQTSHLLIFVYVVNTFGLIFCSFLQLVKNISPCNHIQFSCFACRCAQFCTVQYLQILVLSLVYFLCLVQF